MALLHRQPQENGLAHMLETHHVDAGRPPALPEERPLAAFRDRYSGGQFSLSGIFMTGGDIARAVCRELGATALRALGEVQPGIPAGLLVGGPLDGTRVVTKAGGFGGELSIARSIQYLQGKAT